MTDLEMTRLCAEAVGVPSLNDDFVYEDSEGSIRSYTPLFNDHQAMALVRHFRLNIEAPEPPAITYWTVYPIGDSDKLNIRHNDDLNRAIVECAAKIAAQHAPASTRTIKT